MIKYLFTCRSLTYAQRMARFLEQNGIPAVVVRIPTEVHTEGCGYGVRISERFYARSRTVLQAGGMAQRRIFRITADGEYAEVLP